MGLVNKKPVFGVSDQVKPNLACSATELENRNFVCSKFRYVTFQRVNNKGADQTVQMPRIRLQTPKTGFLVLRSITG